LDEQTSEDTRGDTGGDYEKPQVEELEMRAGAASTAAGGTAKTG
jgi:hypothetical protein